MFNHGVISIVWRLSQIGVVSFLISWLYAWLCTRSRASHKHPASKPQNRQRTQSPTKIPPCPACLAESQEKATTSSDPPPIIEHKRGAPRQVDTSSHFCPDPACRYYGWIGRGNLRSNGHPNGSRYRQLQCTVCGKYFMETCNTVFYRKKVPAETIWQALAALAEGLGIRQTARVFGQDPNTIEAWLRQAAEHMEAVSHYMIHDLQLSQVQLDEMWALLGHRDTTAGCPTRRAVRWVWAGIDPVSKLLLACVVGDRSLETAQLLIHTIASLLAPDCIPLFLSDQWSPYATALLTHFGHWVSIPRRYKRGRSPQPRWMPLPGLTYAQLVKRREKGRVVDVSYRVVYGTIEKVTAILKQSGVGKVVNTAFIERINLSIRHGVAALKRKALNLAKTDPGLVDQLALRRTYYNFCLPHTSLRLELPKPLPTKGSGSPKKWIQRSPAMAADLTDHVWSMEELLLFRVPPHPQSKQAVA